MYGNNKTNNKVLGAGFDDKKTQYRGFVRGRKLNTDG